MAVIRRLPDDLANQIAAGEVVERPASVVKELLENSLDAGATRIRVDIEGGGITLIRVADDGCGMSEADACLAIERHATSKIRAIEDLQALGTFGFRGEALPSIASVSRFVLKTRRKEDTAGTEVRIDGGGTPEIRPCGQAPGTIIEIKDLFFNVPARRKFLKATATESAHISDVVESLALSAPTLTITLSREGRVAREWLRSDSRQSRVTAALEGEELASLSGEQGILRVEAYLARPERARASGSSLRLFVNDRLVKDRTLLRTVSQAYGSVLPPGRYPVGVVYVELPPGVVDVNVHPQKAEVRFADGRAVADALFSILSLELGRAFGLAPPHHRFTPPQSQSQSSNYSEPITTPISQQSPVWALLNPTPTPPPVSTQRPAISQSGPSQPAQPQIIPFPSAFLPASKSKASSSSPNTSAESIAEPDPWGLTPTTPSNIETELKQSAAPTAAAQQISFDQNISSNSVAGSLGFSKLYFIAQSRQMFLICESEQGLVILDQHAAAERVTFHRLKRSFQSRSVAIQPLLFPQHVEVTAEEAALVDELHELFVKAGVDARSIGPKVVAVHGVPQILKRADPERMLRDLLAEALRSGGRAFSDAIDMALATMACHGSIRAGDTMVREEVTALLSALDECDFAGHCPHGRPIVTTLRWSELERKVGR